MVGVTIEKGLRLGNDVGVRSVFDGQGAKNCHQADSINKIIIRMVEMIPMILDWCCPFILCQLI